MVTEEEEPVGHCVEQVEGVERVARDFNEAPATIAMGYMHKQHGKRYLATIKTKPQWVRDSGQSTLMAQTSHRRELTSKSHHEMDSYVGHACAMGYLA